jgi:hypothetical protein
MRAFDPEVVDVIWRTVEPLLPQQPVPGDLLQPAREEPWRSA